MPTNVTINSTRIISDEKYTLKKVAFTRQKQKGGEQNKEAEVFDVGDAATVLLYNAERKKVILTRQFRLPTHLNQNPGGMMIECCAGKMKDKESPEDCIRREALEETGYTIKVLTKLFQVYMSPGTLTEQLHFFSAPYTAADKTEAGGGLEAEQEEVEIMEIDFSQALAMIGRGEIQDAKTIILLLHAETKGYFQ